MNERLEAIKGNIIYAEAPGELTVMPDSWIVTEGGIIRGIFGELPERYAAAEATDYGDMIITPSFTDLHLHAPQYPMLGLGMDLELLGWLNKYAFPTEAMFSDAGYARRVYSKLAHALIERGTTRVCIFSSLHREATNILMDELEKAGVTGYAGKVNMDRNGSEELIETTEESVAETRLFIEENKDRKLIKPILTPRFTPSCTNELMEELGKIAAEYPDIPVQSHLSENTDEMKWVKELHPDCAQYWETYEKPHGDGSLRVFRRAGAGRHEEGRRVGGSLPRFQHLHSKRNSPRKDNAEGGRKGGHGVRHSWRGKAVHAGRGHRGDTSLQDALAVWRKAGRGAVFDRCGGLLSHHRRGAGVLRGTTRLLHRRQAPCGGVR